MQNRMRTFRRPRCPMCGSAGPVKYSDLRDALFGVEGAWDMRGCENAECQCLWLDPCPVPEDIGIAYERYYTHETRPRWQSRLLQAGWGLAGRAYLSARYGRQIEGFPLAIARLLDPLMRLKPETYMQLGLMLRHLPPPGQGRMLLDVGCGDGLALGVLASVGWDVQGQDLDLKAVQVARNRGLTIHHGALASFGFSTGSFDAVTMSHVVEHVHEPEALFREILRILKPGGTFTSVTPNVRSEIHETFGRSWIDLDPPRHLVLFSANAIRELAQRAGFVSAEVTSSLRFNRGSEIGSRAVQRNGAYRWGDRGSHVDRLVSAYHLFCSTRARGKDQLKGDELVLAAKKSAV